MASSVDTHYARAFGEASTRPFWLDRLGAPPAAEPLADDLTADLVIVGAGFTGLWAAIQAAQDDPAAQIVVLEQDTVAFGATGRNGGFCEATLTHGLANGIERFPHEIRRIEALAAENFEAIRATVRDHTIDCDWIEPGGIAVARAPHELAWLEEMAASGAEYGHEAEVLDRDAMRAQVHSPTYLGGFWHKDGSALVDPARLAVGLAGVARSLGVRIVEGTHATDLELAGAGVKVTAAGGSVTAERAILATNAFPPLARTIRRRVLPVYDYVLMTEPLTPEQRASIGWERRQGMADLANRFHYYRTTDDGRILWGGYDAIYHWRNHVHPDRERRDATYATLAQHFFETFPQLEGVRFSHAWAGAIDTCSRFSVFWGTLLDGRASYAVGYTGLGVGATRFGARVALDLAAGRDTEVTRMDFVRKKPLPFPPEPLRWLGVKITTRALARADRREGRRGPWLKMLDSVGLGFDS